MMSNLLRDYGHITRKELADEQLRQLKELHAEAKVGTFERMHMAHNLGIVLGYQDRRADGVALMEAAIDEYAKGAHGGAFPADAESTLQTATSFREQLKEYAAGEAFILAQQKRPANTEVGRWLTNHLNEFYFRAMSNDAAVSLGEGAKLYAAFEARLVKAADEADPNHRAAVVTLLGRVYRLALQKKIGDPAADLKVFAHKTLPPLLKKYPANYEQIVGDVSRTVREVIGPEEAILFVLDRIDAEPSWLRRNNGDGWQHHGSTLAVWRAESKLLPAPVEARLLKLALTELRRDLREQQHRNRTIFYANHSYYWKEKEEDFVKVAEEIYAERKESGQTLPYIADYFYHGCNRPDRAIEVLFAAHAKKLLNDEAQVQLVRYLHWRSRHAESIAILVPLVARVPGSLDYRYLLCLAYFHTGREGDLKAAFAAAEEYFRHKDRWGVGPMAHLASTALQCKLYERSATIYGELIPLYQRTAPRRGVGDGQLADYYAQLARAYAGLGKTAEAVDAASGAVVSWGQDLNSRKNALTALQSVIAESPDLEKFVQHLDAQMAETNLINPTVRKAVGQTYFDRGNYPAAMAHLQLAMTAQPNDPDTQRLLIECHDKMKNPEGAVAQVLRILELTRRDIKLYENLGDRYALLGQTADAERARTSIVEVTPNEAEGHQLLAEIRQKQDRWAEAIVHWEQVAKIRALEPTGLIGLAMAQLHEKHYEKAAATLGKLKAKPWPNNFPNAQGQIAELERQLNAARK